MLVIDKPAGLPVHRGPKGGMSLEDFFDALRFGLPRPPALAHRLDKETSGCLVLGRHRKALAHLGLLFKHGKVGKTYWAVVEGGPDQDEGVIDLPLGRLDQTRGWWMKPDPQGQPAVTKWAVLGRTILYEQLPPERGRSVRRRQACAACAGLAACTGRGSDAARDPSPDHLRWSDPPLSGEGEVKCGSPASGGGEGNGSCHVADLGAPAFSKAETPKKAHLAGAGAADRADASVAGALRGDGLADRGR
ncbi:MAG: RNA pseudouridine synthase [Xanthobacteraceae bacterium]